jgi:hypothetical protein
MVVMAHPIVTICQAPVAQWTEHQPSKLLVVSSNLTGGALEMRAFRSHFYFSLWYNNSNITILMDDKIIENTASIFSGCLK